MTGHLFPMLLAGLLQEVPAEVAQGQLEAALEAGVEAAPGAFGGAGPLGFSPVLVFVLLVALGVLVLLRRLDRGVPLLPAGTAGAGGDPLAAGSGGAAEAGPPPRTPAPGHRRGPRAPEPVPLPPHVSAMLQRVSERRAASDRCRTSSGEDETGEEGQPPSAAPHVDLWVS